MGTSHHGPISLIMEIIHRLQPHSVLDVGCGSGKWGVLCREYLGRRTYLEAIEVWPDYITPVHRHIYDRVTIGDARDFVPGLEKASFDLVLLVDVFEHLDPSDGAVLIDDCATIARSTLISVPATWDAQGPINGNEYEIHRAHYDARYFEDRGFQTWRIANHIIALRADYRMNLRPVLARWAVASFAPRITAAMVALRGMLGASLGDHQRPAM